MGVFTRQHGKQPCVPVNKIRDAAFHPQRCTGDLCCRKHSALLVQHRLAFPAQLYPPPRCTAIKAVGHLGIGTASTSSHPVPMACTHLAPSPHSPSFSRCQHRDSLPVPFPSLCCSYLPRCWVSLRLNRIGANLSEMRMIREKKVFAILT